MGATEGYSLEITTKDIDSFRATAPGIADETPVAITFLPGEEQGARVAAAVAVRELGFEPMPHFSARRIRSTVEFEDYVQAVVRDAGVERCFLVAGDPPEPEGPYFDSSALIESGAFERAGIKAIGIGGHPEGHPVMTRQQCWDVIDKKVAMIESRGMAPLIVTQFGFDPDALLLWLSELRSRGVKVPVRIGVPGPAGIKQLLRFAKFCGVGVSTRVLAKYGISLTKLMGSAGPDKLIDRLAAELGDEHGRVRLHFYSFGGIEKTVEWINDYDRRHDI